MDTENKIIRYFESNNSEIPPIENSYKSISLECIGNKLDPDNLDREIFEFYPKEENYDAVDY